MPSPVVAPTPGRRFLLAALCVQHLALEGATAAAYLAASPTLLLAEPADAAAVVRWLHASPGWRRQALRRNLAAHAQILLTPVAQLEAAAATLQLRLDASTDELCLLLALAPRLLALPQGELEAAAAAHPAAWRLAGAYMDRPALLMRDAAVRGVVKSAGPEGAATVHGGGPSWRSV